MTWVTVDDVNNMLLGSTTTVIKCSIINSKHRHCKTTIPGWVGRQGLTIKLISAQQN